MAAWTEDELDRPVPIWVVRVGDDLYVRSYRGRGGSWFRAAVAQEAGRIQAGGVTKDVAFAEEADPGVNDQIDAAYRSKYRRYGGSYTGTMASPAVRAATLKLAPRSL